MILLRRLQVRNFKRLAEVSLDFAERGTLLVEGDNEAGKSSLFEAIYYALYGRALLPDRDYKNEELRSYAADEMEVRLEFSLDGREFAVSRKLGRNSTAALECPAPDGGAVLVRGVKPVAGRLQQEMPLSADALLNTCFVEQKKLERLELLNAADRHRTVNELLNLRVLTLLADEFRVTAELRREVESRRQRARIAELDAALPGLEEEEQTARRCLALARLRECLAALVKVQQEIAGTEGRLKEVDGELRQVGDRLEDSRKLLQKPSWMGR